MDLKDNTDIVLNRNSLMFLRICFLFPNKEEIDNPEKNVYIKFVLLNILAIYYPIGLILHLMINIRHRAYNHIDEDVIVILTYFGVLYYCWQYFRNVKEFIVIFKKLSDFDTFGKPRDFDKMNRIFDKISIVYFYFNFLTMSLMTLSNFIQIDKCKQENEKNDINEICGMIGRIWLPFNYDYFPVKQLVFAYEYYATILIFPFGADIIYMIMETTLHINMRFQHLLETFSEVLEIQDPTSRREKFNKAVQYHYSLTELGETFKNCCKGCCMVHMIMTAPVLGGSLYRIATMVAIDSICLFFCTTLSLCVSCSTGQQLEDSSEFLGDILYQSDWYKLEPALQRDVMLVMLRTRRPNVLTLGPFGTMSYKTIVAIAKTSYSYMALMQQTM